MSLVNYQLGKYVLTEQLGQGGMAEVYKAYQTGLERHVAVKVMHRHLTQSADLVTRFQREAKSVGQLQHRHILQVIDFDIESGIYYLVMEFIQGQTLADYLAKKKALPVEEALHIAAQLVDALDYAHRNGVIHRDIKPANVMLRNNNPNEMILTDFGLVRLANEANLTVKGTLIGTPAYMAPEAFRGNSVNELSDIYSLGVVLYQMVTGNKPYSGDTPYAIITKQMNEELPPPRQFKPDLPDVIEKLLLKALAKDPAQRFQSAAEFQQAIQQAQMVVAHGSSPYSTQGLPYQTTTPPPYPNNGSGSKSSQWLILAAGAGSVIFFIAIAVGLMLLVGPEITGAENAQAEDEPVSEQSDQVQSANPTAESGAVFEIISGEGESDIGSESAASTPINMIDISAGRFLMGSKFGERNEQPEHDVFVDSFYLDVYEVSNRQYRTCVTEGGCTLQAVADAASIQGYRDDPAFDGYPAVGVTWDQAVDYCQWLGKRLPTEAEWEYAASGPENQIYPWGNDFVPEFSAAGSDDLQPVDSFAPGISPFGMYQMAGNAGEWVLDVYDEAFYENSPVQNPFSSTGGDQRVYRGGTFGSTDPGFYTTSRRFVENRSASKVWIGFRCALDK